MNSIEGFLGREEVSGDDVTHASEEMGLDISSSVRFHIVHLCALGLSVLALTGCSTDVYLYPAPERDEDSSEDTTDYPPEVPGDDDDDAATDDFVLSPGTWVWNPYEIAQDADRLDQAFVVLNGNQDFPGFERVYSSFTVDQLLADPDPVALWNSELVGSGRTSDLLIGDNRLLCGVSARENYIQAFIDFQNSRENLMERFRGIHVDLETHTDNPECFYSWNDLTREQRLAALNQYLLGALTDIRTQLDDAGMQDIEISVDLPVWYDQIHDPENVEAPENGLWDTEAERQEFFDAIAAEVDSVSFLAYCRDELSDILESIVIEELLLPADMPVRIGLDASHQIGRNSDDNSENDVECETWESLLDLNKTRGFIEDAEHNTDTHSLDELMRIHFGE